MVNHHSITGKEDKSRWIILGVLYLTALSFAITFQSIPPILSLVMAELALSHAQGGLLMSFFALPGIFIAIPAGILADRYNQKAIVIVALASMLVGAMVVASGSSLSILALGRVISGVGAMTLTVLLPQLLAQWFAGREIGTAMGVINTAMPLGTVISLSLLSLAGENLGWRASIWMSVGLSLVTLAIFAGLYTTAPTRRQRISAPSEGVFRSIMRSGIPIWMVGVAWMLFNASHISFVTFTPDFLESTGFSVASAGFLTALTMWPALVVSPLTGYMIDKLDRKRTIIAAGGSALAILIVLTPGAIGWIAGFIFLTGIAAAIIPPSIHSLVPVVSSPERLGLGYGIVSTCLNVGLLVGPAVAGLIRDVTGSYQASYALMSGLALIIIPVIALSRRQNKIPPTMH